MCEGDEPFSAAGNSYANNNYFDSVIMNFSDQNLRAVEGMAPKKDSFDFYLFFFFSNLFLLLDAKG